MDIKVLELDDEGDPEFITVRMHVLEAAFMTKVVGVQSDKDAEDVFPGGAIPSHSIYKGLTDGVFHRYWDGGVHDYLKGQ
jgi:hypothetical protein